MLSLRDRSWEVTYATSDLRDDGSEVDILHDFYIPALSCSTSYDRVAGYFSSTSLAAASQGFTMFMQNNGKARFIVGADLHHEDAQAILKGDQARLSEKLEEALGSEEDWQDSVHNGVKLLAWMVAKGYLTVKVAIRVHRSKQEPCPMEFRGDGYVHEKWALFRDAEGNGLMASGSLNESRTALEINAESLDIETTWEGRGHEKFERRAASFESMWEGTHPTIKTFDLPEAIRRKLVRISETSGPLREIDGTMGSSLYYFAENAQNSPPPLERLRFAFLRLAPLLPGGESVGMETAPIVPWPHQRFVTRRILQSFPDNHLLCDEVGLGKTIESGLIFRSLWLSGKARSIRVFAPASLTSQWMHEMAEKFFLPFHRRLGRSGKTEWVEPASGNIKSTQGSFFDHPLEIISTGLLSQGGPSRLLAGLPQTDVILVDEAHKARRKEPDATNREPSFNNLYRELEQAIYPQARSLLLATATPMQLNRVEAFDLLRFMPAAGAVQFSGDLADLFYQVREKLLDKGFIERYEQDWLRRYLRNARLTAREQWQFVHDWVLEIIGSSNLDDFVDHGQDPPFWEDLQPALTMLSPLGRSMMRHTRSLLREYQRDGLLHSNLAWRNVHVKSATLRDSEHRIYSELQDYCRQLAQKIGANMQESRQRAAVGFYLSFLRQRFSSSFRALNESLKRRIQKIDRTLERQTANEALWHNGEDLEELPDEDKESLILKNRSTSDLVWEKGKVRDLLDDLGMLPEVPDKSNKLLNVIQERRYGQGRVRQVVVFTRYTDTLNHLYELLTRRLPNCPVGVFTGDGGCVRWGDAPSFRRYDRTAIKRFFLSQEIDILLCTDAAAQGLNLQSADLLINFDLPWNPMLLEQRIGRIDRIGQLNKRVDVINLFYQGTVEEVVYDRLVRRFKDAISISGELQFSLLPVEQSDFEDFAKAEGEDEEKRIDEEGLVQRAEEKMRQLQERQKITEFKPSEQKQAYEALEREQGRYDLPVTLETIWTTLTTSQFLEARGCGVESFEHGKAFRVQGHVIPGIDKELLLTTNIDLYERGLPTDDERELRFATYGEPAFEALLNFALIGESEVKNTWQQREPISGIQTPSGNMISSWDQLHKDLEIGEGTFTVVSRRDLPDKRRSERTGVLQKKILDAASAALTEKHLLDRQAPPSQHLEKIEQYRRQKQRETVSQFKIAANFKEKNAALAKEKELLWPLEDGGRTIVITGDPLLLQAASSVIERNLQSMKPENRTATNLAVRIRRRIGNGVLDN